MAQPEAYIGNVAANFDDSGKLTKEDTQKFLKDFVKAFQSWVEKLL